MADIANTTVRLTVVNPKDEGNPYNEPKEFTFSDEGANVIYIGRAPGNSVVLDDRNVSGTHIRIIRHGSEFFLEDLNSSNGTHLNQNKIEPQVQKLLRSNDRIRIVNYVITFHEGFEAFQLQSSENTKQIALEMIQSVLDGANYVEKPPKLILMTGAMQGQMVELSDAYTEIRIGRDPHRCQFHIDDENISREHALVRRDWTGVFIRDLNSRNGVIVNGQRLERNAEARLNDRDEIVLGTYRLSFSDPEGAQIDDKIDDIFASEEAEPEKKGRTPISKPAAPPPSMPGTEPEPAPEVADVSSEAEDLPPAPAAPGSGMDEAVPAPMSNFGRGDDEDGPPEPIIETGLTGKEKAIIAVVVGVSVSVVLVVMVLLFMS